MWYQPTFVRYTHPPHHSLTLEEVSTGPLLLKKYSEACQSSKNDLDVSASPQKSGDDVAIPAHQLWEAFVEVMCCTQRKGRGWRGPAALFMSPSASFQKVLLHRPVGSGTRRWGWVVDLIPPAVLGATAQTCDLDQPVPQPSLFWSRLCHHVQYKQLRLCNWNLQDLGENLRKQT